MDEIEKVLKERGKIYGDAHEQFKRWEALSLIWIEYYQNNQGFVFDFDQDNYIDVDSFSGLIRMALLKLVRIAANPIHKDSWLDLYGYLRLAEKEIFKDEQK